MSSVFNFRYPEKARSIAPLALFLKEAAIELSRSFVKSSERNGV